MSFWDDVTKALGWKEIAKVVLPVEKKILKTVVSPKVMEITKAVAGQVLDLAPSATAASIPAPASPAPATLPLETVDVPTASYLEMVEDQAIKQQKALAYQVKGSGIVSDQQAQELAMSAAEEPADLTWVIIVGVLGLILFGRKLWR